MKATQSLSELLKLIHDEAAHILGTEAEDPVEVSLGNASEIMRLAKLALPQAEAVPELLKAVKMLLEIEDRGLLAAAVSHKDAVEHARAAVARAER